MKKYIFFFLAAVLMSNGVNAQRYLHKMSGVHITAGSTEKLGFFVAGGYSIYTKHHNRWHGQIDYFQNTFKQQGYTIPQSQLTAEAGYYLRFFHAYGQSLFISIGAHGLFGYEWINWGKKLLPDGAQLLTRDKFIYGGSLGIEIEYYINDRYVLLFSAKEKITGGSDLGIFHTEWGGGIKIILNN